MDTPGAELEALRASFADDAALETYRSQHDLKPGLIPRAIGGVLIGFGNLLYGKTPTYLKLRSIEVIARVPYQSWTSVAFTLLTFCFRDTKRALELSRQARYAEYAQANETMHVVVISELARKERAGFIRHTAIPLLFSFVYFWFSYLFFLLAPRAAYELNYIFESHAYAQYDAFLRLHGEEMKARPVSSDYLKQYGRMAANEYDFFVSVRNDELIHRGISSDRAQGRTI